MTIINKPNCEITFDIRGGLVNEQGQKMVPPANWDFLIAGDAGITRKVTSAGNYWRVMMKKGKRNISKGIWAPADVIAHAINDVSKKRETQEYQKQQEYSQLRRNKKQQEYEVEFCLAVEDFLNFHDSYKVLQKRLAMAVTEHAIPIGSGTVARTSLIPLPERASRAVIAWMRHNTTAYDSLQIARIKGERRRVRAMLAKRSVQLLENYRSGVPADSGCPIKKMFEL